MLRSNQLGVSRRLFSTSFKALQDKPSKKSSNFLISHINEAQILSKDEKVDIKGPFIHEFKAGQIYDPFDFSLAKLNLDKKKKKLEDSSQKVFDTQRLNPLDFYTNPRYLSQYVTSTGRILPRDVTNLSLKNQKRLAKAIKRSRSAGLLSSVHQDVSKLVNTNFIGRKN